MTALQAEDWKIDKRGRRCSACDRSFASGEEHYSGIVEVEKRFERRDLCAACWARKPELFSFWKTRMPKIEERRLENINAMTDFFKKLLEKPGDEPSRQKITYLTALLLARKRRVKLLGTAAGKLRVEKSWDGEVAEIADPPIGDQELDLLKVQMEQLFEVELGADFGR